MLGYPTREQQRIITNANRRQKRLVSNKKKYEKEEEKMKRLTEEYLNDK